MTTRTSTLSTYEEVVVTGGERVEGGVVAVVNRVLGYELVEDQSWFWTPEWQASVNRALEQASRSGDKQVFDTDQGFLDALDQ